MGSTSQDVNTGLGQPMVGQTSSELHHDGQAHRKHHGGGLEGVGASKQDRFERTIPSQRGIERDEARSGQRGDLGASAEEIDPEPSERLDQEWNYEPGTKRH